jgi:hypothetical protein
MTKEEKIIEAYGEYYEKMKPWISEEGWFNKNAFYQEEFKLKYQELDMFFSHLGDFMIPQSIVGITNNNRWIKIESENDLPKERGSFWTFIEGKEVVINTFNTFDDMEFTFDNGKVTHYQSLIKPNEPLY